MRFYTIAAMMILGILVMPMGIVTPADAAPQNGLEDFDSLFVGSNIHGDFYKYQMSAGFEGYGEIQNAVAQSAPNAFLVNSGTQGINLDLQYSYKFQGNFCFNPNAAISFSYRLSGVPTAGFGRYSIGTQAFVSGKLPGFGLKFGPGPSIAGYAVGSGGTEASATLGGGATINTWHNVTFSNFICSGASRQITITVDATHIATLALPSDITSEVRYLTTFGDTTGGAAFPNHYMDDINVTGLTITAIDATTTATVTGLTGFDIDPTGAAIIARTDAGDFVRTYNGATLENLGNEDTDCSKTGGVASQGNYVTYFTCDVATPSVPELLKIRTAGLSPVGQPGDCNRGNFCVEDILIEPTLFSGGIKGDQDDDNYLALFEAFPIDFSQIRTSGSNRALMAWAFADAGGRIGVFTYTHINNDFDSSDIAETSIASQLPDQICTHRDSTGTSYLYASSTSSNAYGFRVGFTERGIAIAAEDNYALMPLLTQVFSGPINTAGARGVGCGEGKFAVLTNTALFIWNRNLNSGQAIGAPITALGLTSVPTAGVAMSYNGAHTVYVSGGSWHLLNITGGEIATGILPTGDFRAIKLYGTCGSVWVATSTKIAVYDVQSVCGNLTIFNPVQDLNDIDGDGIPNQFDPDVDGDGIPNESDPDIDGDGIPNALDPTPNGAVGPIDPAARPTSGPGSGLINVDATNSIYFSLGTILLLAVLGWALVTGRGRRDG